MKSLIQCICEYLQTPEGQDYLVKYALEHWVDKELIKEMIEYDKRTR